MRRAIPVVLLVLLASCTEVHGSPDVDLRSSPDIPSDAVSEALREALLDVLGVGRLTFVDEQGDDQKSCVDVDVCTYNVSYPSERTLRVRYTVEGATIAGVEIAFEVVDDLVGHGQLAAASARTDEDGVASGSIKVIGNPCSGGGLFQVKASVVGQPALAPLFFVIWSEAKCDAYFTVSFVYNGSKLFDGVMVYLVKSHQAATADLACADLDPIALPEADLVKGPQQLSQTAKFVMLPGLEVEKEQFYTIVARGERVDGTPLAWGCDDTDGHVLITSSKHVTVTLKDIPPRIVGTYDLKTRMNLLDALPGNVQTVVNFVLTFIATPSTSLLRLACELDDGTLQAFCGWVFADPDDPETSPLTALGTTVLARMDAFLADAVESWTGNDIPGLGQDVQDLLDELTLLATFDVTCEPDANGLIPAACTSASWHTVSVLWRHGLLCPPNDDACGRTTFYLQALGHDVALSSFPATLLHTGEYSELTIGQHALRLEVGRLFDDLLQKLVLPSVFGDGSDGQPVIDSYEKLLLGLLGGGKECLQPSSAQKSCCAVFAEKVVDETGAVSSDELEQACDTLVQSGSAYLEQALVALDPPTGDTLKLSTRAGQPCKLYDLNSDQKIDAWGKKEPMSERCIWDLEMNVFNAFVDVDENDFYGSEHQ